MVELGWASHVLIIVIGWIDSGHSNSPASEQPKASATADAPTDQALLVEPAEVGDQSSSVEEPISAADDGTADDSADQQPSDLVSDEDQASTSDPDHEVSSYASSGVCDGDYYEASSGDCVHRRVAAASAPSGASAQCNDGTYSFSEYHRGTCGDDGGVDRCL
jgi:Protein of unknown function (DUF3761).